MNIHSQVVVTIHPSVQRHRTIWSWYTPFMGELLRLVQRAGDWRSRSPLRPILAVPNVHSTHQRPVYQSLYCCI